MASIVESINYFLNTFSLTTHLNALLGLLGVTFWHTGYPFNVKKIYQKLSVSHSHQTGWFLL